jgi:hypothetical protein
MKYKTVLMRCQRHDYEIDAQEGGMSQALTPKIRDGTETRALAKHW